MAVGDMVSWKPYSRRSSVIIAHYLGVALDLPYGGGAAADLPASDQTVPGQLVPRNTISIHLPGKACMEACAGVRGGGGGEERGVTREKKKNFPKDDSSCQVTIISRLRCDGIGEHRGGCTPDNASNCH